MAILSGGENNAAVISGITLAKEAKKTSDYGLDGQTGAALSPYASYRGNKSRDDYNDYIHSALNMTYGNGGDLQNYYQNFDRFYSIYPDLELTNFRQYVFFVRPDLNILDEANPKNICVDCENDYFLRDMVERHPTVVMQLTDQLSQEHDFIPFLVGRTESLQIPDLSIKNYSISQPYTNLLMPYAGNAWESKTGGTFDVTFRDDRHLRIQKLFQTWIHYMDSVQRGMIKPKKKYLMYNKFDYAASVYYFVCDIDGTTILWWSKYTGVFPTTVPNSNLSFNLRGDYDGKLSIPFVYFYHEALNPFIFHDFNRNSNPLNRTYVDSYNENVLGTGNGMYGAPFVYKNGVTYYLRWGVPKTF